MAEIDNMQRTMRILAGPQHLSADAAALVYRSVVHPVVLVYRKRVGLYAGFEPFDDQDMLIVLIMKWISLIIYIT